MDVTVAILVVLITVIVTYFLTRSKSRYSYPPGPKGLPFFGNCFQVSLKMPHLSLVEYGKHHGELFTVTILGQKIIVLNSPEVLREAFSENLQSNFAARPMTFLGKYTDDECSSTAFMTTCKLQSRLRKILIKSINMYGEGIQETETFITEELRHVLQWLDKNNCKEVNLAEVIVPSLANIITYLLLGHRFDYESKELKSAIDISLSISSIGQLGVDGVLTMFPFLRFLPFGYGALYRQYMRTMEEYYQHYYHAQKETYTSEVTRGLVDALIRAEELGTKGDNTPIYVRNITSVIKDTMQAGTLTTRTTLLSFFLIIVHHPEVAEKIQAEIDFQIGRDRYPSLQDRVNMPYTSAALLELLRFSSAATNGLPRCTASDTVFRGFHIPKNTGVMMNLYAISHDDSLWEKPYEFCPERFLDESGELLPSTHARRRNIFPFGIGRRSCPGENFARGRIFLFITTLLQRFDFSRPEGSSLPQCDPRHYQEGIIPCPKPFKVRITSRY